MFKSLFLVCVALCCANAAEIPVNRINTGNLATNTQFPYAVSLQQTSLLANTTRGHRCGGVLITLQHVLTAASCVYDSLLNGTLQIIQINDYRVFGGAALLTDDASTDRIRNLLTVTPHPNYTATPTIENNIAVITLETPFNSTVVTPLPLPDASFVPTDGANCTVAGWGAFDTSVVASPQLRFFDKFIWNLNTCTAYYNTLANEPAVPPMSLCAQFRDANIASCVGDDGNGLVCNGILSGIHIHGGYCTAVARPEIYTQVSNYTTWIRSVTGSASTYQPTAVLLAVFLSLQMFYANILS